MKSDKLRYFFLRAITFPLGFLPYRTIHAIGNSLGILSYHVLENFRKKALSNLALASDLKLSNEQIVSVAKESFQNLMITCLEYEKFSREKNIHKVAVCKNPDYAAELIKNDTGVIFFCGHQANWEILFLEGTARMPGVAIGKPAKNPYLYSWVLSIREKFGGTIITPRNAIKEGLRALKNNKFLGIVGDQGMPDSGFCSPFLGRMAWTSPIPAMLSFRSQKPIIVATTKRVKNKYEITYSDPIWPDLSKTMEEEIPRMMKQSLSILESAIKETPGQWLWQHNRWKQQLPGSVIKKYRLDSLCVVVPKEDIGLFNNVIEDFRTVYPTELILFLLPQKLKERTCNTNEQIKYYTDISECFIDDYRIKLLFNFTRNAELSSHFKKKAVMRVVNLDLLASRSSLALGSDLRKLLQGALLHAR